MILFADNGKKYLPKPIPGYRVFFALDRSAYAVLLLVSVQAAFGGQCPLFTSLISSQDVFSASSKTRVESLPAQREGGLLDAV